MEVLGIILAVIVFAGFGFMLFMKKKKNTAFELAFKDRVETQIKEVKDKLSSITHGR